MIDFAISTGYPIDINTNDLILNIGGYNLVDADIKNLKLICDEDVKWSNTSPITGDNKITASFSLDAGTTECKIIVDITDNPAYHKNMQAILKDVNNTSKLNITGNDLRYNEYENDIIGYNIDITNEYPLSIDKQWFGDDNKLTNNSVGNNIMGLNFYVNQPITIEKMTINLDGDYLQDSDIANLKLICDDIAQWTILSPIVGDNVITDSIFFDNGNYNCQLKIDITDNPNGNEKIKATLKNPSNQNYWIVKNNSNNIVSNINPSYDINGEEYKILIPSLTIDASYYDNHTYLGGTTDANIVSFDFTAGEASDIIIKSIKLNAFLSNTANTSTFTADEKGALSGVEEVLTHISIYDDNYLLGAKSLYVGQNNVSVTFDDIDWMIPSWENKQLTVRADIIFNGPLGGDDDTIAIAIESTNSVIARDANTNNMVTPIILNGNTNPDYYQTIKAFGTLNMYSQWQPASSVIAGTNGVLYATVEFVASNEDFIIDRLRVVNDRYDYVGDDEFANIILEDNNGTKIATANLVNGIADFTGLNIYIPKDEQTFIYVKADLNTIANGADSGDYTSLKIDYNDNFKAMGQNSGHTIVSVGSYDVGGNNMYTYKSVPIITDSHSSYGILMNGHQTLFEFDITNFNNNIGWKKFIFSIMKDSDTEITYLKLYSEGEEVVGTIIASSLNQGDTSGTVIFVADGEQNVNAGSTKTYKLEAMINNVIAGSSYINTNINQSGEYNEYYVEPANYATVASTNASFVWSDKSADNHSENTADWNNDYLIKNLPVSQTLSN